MKGKLAVFAACAAGILLNGCGGGGSSASGPRFFVIVAHEGAVGSDYTTYKFRLNDREADEVGTVEDFNLQGLDERPATGELFTYDPGEDAVYRVSKSNGSLTLIGNPPDQPDAGYGIDFNPVVDRIRVVGRLSSDNFRLNPNNGALSGQDTDLTPATQIGDVAYSNNVAGAATTTLYAIRTDVMALVRIGGVDGTPSPNLGEVFGVGLLNIASAHIAGFDIAADGTAYLLTQPVDFSSVSLYTVNLTTGEATLVGTVDDVEEGPILGFTVEN